MNTKRLPRLGVVIPYRDRAEHLRRFVPHLAAYFSRDKDDRHIPVRFVFVEQVPGLPFNRGLLRNIGYQLLKESIDYVCFHDVDYLPIWADYSMPSLPSMIVWYGAETRPLNPGVTKNIVENPLDEMFATVVLLKNRQFEAANGYATDYWGWGWEDHDLRDRLTAAGFKLGRRKGTFDALDHKNEGQNDDYSPTPDAARNEALYRQRWGAGTDPTYPKNGLSTTRFRIVKQATMPPPPVCEREIPFEMVTVDFIG